MSKQKIGAISQEDRRFILENRNKMSIEEIAEKLGRNPVVIERVIKTYTTLPQPESETARWHLRRSNYWRQFKNEFTEEELNYIEEQYLKITQQFQEDIKATEEIQILDLVKIDVLQHRNLKAKQRLSDMISDCTKRIEEIESSVGGNFSELTEEDKDRIMDLKNQEAACMQAESARTSEYIQLQEKKDKLQDKVMGSRDLRVKQATDNKKTFSEYIKELINRDKQEQESRFIQLYKMSIDKEEDRLSQPYTYADNIVDNPILSAQVVEKFEQKEKEETKIEGESEKN